MTAATQSGRGPTTLGDAVSAERTKFWSVRSTRTNVFATVLACAAMAAVVSATISITRDEPLETIPALDVFTAPMLGLDAAAIVLFIGAATFFGSEFTKKQGMVTFSVTPNRQRVLAAKLVVTSAVGVVVGIVCVAVAVSIGRLVASASGAAELPLTDPAALRLMSTTLFLPVYYAVVVGLFATAVRSTVGAVGLGFAVVLVFPAFAGFLPDAAAQLLAPLFPRAAFDSLAGVVDARRSRECAAVGCSRDPDRMGGYRMGARCPSTEEQRCLTT